MSYEALKMETGEIITDYTAHKLRSCGFNNWKQATDEPAPAMRTMRLLGRQFEDAYIAAFEDMTRNINIEGQEAHEAISNVSSVLFSNGIQWGRIIGLIVFAAKLSLKAMEANAPQQVDNIVLWTTNHLKSEDFCEWITQHGSWVSKA